MGSEWFLSSGLEVTHLAIICTWALEGSSLLTCQRGHGIVLFLTFQWLPTALRITSDSSPWSSRPYMAWLKLLTSCSHIVSHCSQHSCCIAPLLLLSCIWYKGDSQRKQTSKQKSIIEWITQRTSEGDTGKNSGTVSLSEKEIRNQWGWSSCSYRFSFRWQLSEKFW